MSLWRCCLSHKSFMAPYEFVSKRLVEKASSTNRAMNRMLSLKPPRAFPYFSAKMAILLPALKHAFVLFRLCETAETVAIERYKSACLWQACRGILSNTDLGETYLQILRLSGLYRTTLELAIQINLYI